jgi:hypothetical protein
MTDEQEFATTLASLMTMVERCALNDGAVALYREAAEKVGYKKSTLALRQIAAERTSRDPFPSIADMLSRTEENALDAEEIAASIIAAVSRFGPYQALETRAKLTKIAWDIVCIQGGWESVCQLVTYDNAPTLQAQWRQLARVMIQRKRADRLVRIGYLKPVQEILEDQR